MSIRSKLISKNADNLRCSHKHTQPECKSDQECCHAAGKWYKERLFIVVSVLLAIHTAHFILGYFGITFLHKLVYAFYDYAGMIWLPILIGLIIGGLVDYFVPEEYIIKHLSRHRKRTILYSVGLGFLMSACSHGILAISMELYRKGASVPAVITFLLASPWANLPVTILLFGLFGWKAFFFVASALAIAVTTGLIYQALDRRGFIERNEKAREINGFSVYKDIKKRWNKYRFSIGRIKEDVAGILKGAWSLSKMVLWWLLIGTALASAARAYVPKGFFSNYMGASLLGLAVTLAIATVLEICSEGTAPLAFEIFRQTGAFGNAFVFLMAGVVTDYTEIGLLWSNIGKRSALWLPVITVPQVIALGYIFNLLL